MIFSFKLFHTLGLMIISNIFAINASDSVPVLLWGGKGENSSPEPVNPLHKTSRLDFEKVLSRKLGKSSPPLIVFVKDSFCIEDFTQNKENLKKVKSAGTIYLPAVESPMSIFENLSSYNITIHEDLESINDNQFVIFPITDLESVTQIYSELRESKQNLIAALTGRYCVYSRSERVRRALDSNDTSLFYMSKDGNILFYAERVYLQDGENTSLLKNLSGGSESKRHNNSVILSLIFMPKEATKLTLRFNFTKIQGYYDLTSLSYSFIDANQKIQKILTLSSRERISIPPKFSYHCSNQGVFKNGTVTLKFTGLQIQLDANGTFSEAYDCVGFTTIPIWTGLFVTAILALIMIWGLTMIMDIRTMDRFDDPKGKTITVSATE